MVLPKIATRLLTTTDPKALWKFIWTFGVQGMLSMRRFHRRLRGGRQFPPFMFLSITNRCNLHCQGCWVTTGPAEHRLEADLLDRVIGQASSQGTRFFGVMGGEPLLHPDVPDLFARHPRCYFQLFSNGMLLTPEIARKLARSGNVTPLISVEGNEVVSDVRRGGRGVFSRTLDGVRHCLRAGLVTGVATSVCKSNIDTLATPEFLDRLIDLGVHYVWYYTYRPVGARPSPELALDADQLVSLREFVVEMRCRKPIVIVDTYYDALGQAVCPAVEGLSYHVNPTGDVEPCPPIQFARENIHTGDDVVDLIEGSAFLREFREFAATQTRGCVLLEQPDRLREFMRAQGAHDATGRQTGYDELARMTPGPSQYLPGREIPEKHWAYRFAKKHWFFGFGAYA